MKKLVLLACAVAGIASTILADTIEWDPSTRMWIKRDDHGHIIVMSPGEGPNNVPDAVKNGGGNG